MPEKKIPPTMSVDDVRLKLIAVTNSLGANTPTFSGLRKVLDVIEKSQLPNSDVSHYYGDATAAAITVFQVAAATILLAGPHDVLTGETLGYTMTAAQARLDVKWRRVIIPQMNALLVVLNHAIWDTSSTEEKD